jgi:hypothetical protein
MTKRKTGRNKSEQAVKLHMQELIAPIPGWMWDRIVKRSKVWRRALTEHVPAADPRPRGRGRPQASDSPKQRTSDSYNAALFVHMQQRNFRQLNDTKWAPNDATEAFIELAVEMYPLARRGTIDEYIRRNRTFFPWG